MKRYSVEKVRDAYKTSSFAGIRVPFDSLYSEWKRYIGEEKVDSTDRSVAGRVFGRLSLFEMDCPRRVTPVYHFYDLALKSQQEGDTLVAALHYQKAFELSGGQDRIWELLAIQWISAGRPEMVLAIDGDSVRFSSFKQFYRGEAMFLMNDTVGASAMLLELAADSTAHIYHDAIERRRDFERWSHIVDLNYRSPRHWPDPRSLDENLVGAWIRKNGVIPQATIPPIDISWLHPESRTFTELETIVLALVASDRIEEARSLIPYADQKVRRLRERERLQLMSRMTELAAQLP